MSQDMVDILRRCSREERWFHWGYRRRTYSQQAGVMPGQRVACPSHCVIGKSGTEDKVIAALTNRQCTSPPQKEETPEC